MKGGGSRRHFWGRGPGGSPLRSALFRCKKELEDLFPAVSDPKARATVIS
jgi:hypothetical protein